jgi:4-amino-4-deoxy-L-arabinose transferase-like glycosyltransferase
MNLKTRKLILAILVFSLVLRIVFVVFLAKTFYQRENIWYDNDTESWITSFVSLWENGTYTCDPQSEFGFFGRMPGYSFFAGFIYVLSGQHADIAFPLIGWLQVILDVWAVWLVFCIARRMFGSERTAVWTAFLYACYPFIIVWTPVVYSESISVFFLVLALYFLTRAQKWDWFLCGLVTGIDILFRPQTALIVPLILIYFVLTKKPHWFKKMAVFLLAVTLSYGIWPLRNYINHQKLVFTQDLRAFPNWNTDVISFMQYIYTVKTDWEPQFTQILHKEKVVFPEECYISPGDSAKLDKAVVLAQDCGRGFSFWSGFWKGKILGKGCPDDIAPIFDELRKEQIEKFPFRVYVKIPLKNLEKAIFKGKTAKGKGGLAAALVPLLFYYRTLLILLGLAGSIFLYRKKIPAWILFAGFTLLVYLSLCFGTGIQFRNIEIRYFLQPDVLLIFPAAFLLDMLAGKITGSKKKLAAKG